MDHVLAPIGCYLVQYEGLDDIDDDKEQRHGCANGSIGYLYGVVKRYDGAMSVSEGQVQHSSGRQKGGDGRHISPEV